jgi:DNA (cytosine-5)-methyltransferase 1
MATPDTATTARRLLSIDVFSGIGGITIALAPFSQSIQYCEWDKYCQSVLVQRMSEGKIDRAPIHGDIRNLHISPAVEPVFLFGGSPCTDISSIGLQKGIVDGPRSSMFFEMMRIVDETPSIRILFLENVANILNLGVKEVVDEVSKRGFSMQWTVRTASAAGAPHMRARWFMLACRGEGAAELVASTVEGLAAVEGSGHQEYPADGNVWRDTEPAARVSFRPSVVPGDGSYDDHWASRCQTLGNTVVPVIVRQAFVDLALAGRKWPQYRELLADTAVPIGEAKYPYPESAIVLDGMLYALPKRRVVAQAHTVEISAPTSQPGTTGTEEAAYVKIDNYPTPRRGITHASTLTDRSVRDLPTILIYCKQTADRLAAMVPPFEPPPDKQLHSVLVPNVNYVEWMMGFPKDWTRIDHNAEAIPHGPTRAAIARGAAVAQQQQQNDDANDDDDAPQRAASEVGLRGRPQSTTKVKPAPGKSRLHGMHVFMKEHPGMDVPHIARLWRELSDAEKASYSERAKQMHLASV